MLDQPVLAPLHRARGSAIQDGGGPVVDAPTSGRAAAHDQPIRVFAPIADHEAPAFGVAARRDGRDG